MNDAHTQDHRQQVQPWPTWLPWLVLIAIGFFLLRGRLSAPPNITDRRTTPEGEPLEATFVNNNQNPSCSGGRPRPATWPFPPNWEVRNKQRSPCFASVHSRRSSFARVPNTSSIPTAWQRGPAPVSSGMLEGRIVTNFHVVEGATKLFVTLADQTQYPAEFLGADPGHDLALLQIDAPREKAGPLADWNL